MTWSEQDLADHYNRLKVRPEEESAPEAQPNELREAFIQEECAKFMEADGWRYLRTDPVSDRGRGKGFGELGMADALFLRPLSGSGVWTGYTVELLWCEFKAGREVAKKHQLEWHAKERARGFMTWISNEDFPATVEGFRQKYAASGLMRRSKWW